jgi:hypothetical protein
MKLQITSEQLEKATRRNNFGILNNSIKKGEGNYLGAVGEVVLMDYYINKGANVTDGQMFDFDFAVNKYKIEVKTQANIYTPKNDWTCHVPNANATQKCDFYAFVFVNLQKNEAYCKGMITKEKWLKVRQFKQKGEMGHKDAFECDTWVVQIKDLTKI